MRPIGLYLTGNRNRNLEIKYGGQAPRSQNFKFLTLRLPPVQWPTFFVHSDKRVSWHTMHKMLRRSTFCGGMALSEFANFGGWYPPPIFSMHIIGLSTLTEQFLFWEYCFPFDWDMRFQSFKMLKIWPGSVPKFGCGEGGKYFCKYLEIFGHLDVTACAAQNCRESTQTLWGSNTSKVLFQPIPTVTPWPLFPTWHSFF